jgi:hypothetical protein
MIPDKVIRGHASGMTDKIKNWIPHPPITDFEGRQVRNDTKISYPYGKKGPAFAEPLS